MDEKNYDHTLDIKVTRIYAYLTLGLLTFILYGSLLPFRFGDISLSAALSNFDSILNNPENITEQGKWIGHVIFYSLLSFFGCGYCFIKRNIGILFLMFAGMFFLGYLTEFLQLFVGGRGTSIIDIYADWVGMVIGLICWMFFGKFTKNTITQILRDNTLSVVTVRKLYLAFAVIIILFPFDFYISGIQIDAAFITKGMPLFDNQYSGMGKLSSLASILLLLPLGVFYRISAKNSHKFRYGPVVIKFFILLLILEILQFFEVSGNSTYQSFLFKMLGFVMGLYLGKYWNLKYLLHSVVKLKILLLVGSPLYLYVVLKMKGVYWGALGSASEINTIIRDMSFLPFVYYVEVGSGEALLSFIFNFAIYFPIGVYKALSDISKGNDFTANITNLAIAGMVFSFVIEILALIFGLKRPDITNIFLGIASIPIGYYFVMMIKNSLIEQSASIRN